MQNDEYRGPLDLNPLTHRNCRVCKRQLRAENYFHCPGCRKNFERFQTDEPCDPWLYNNSIRETKQLVGPKAPYYGR